MRFFSTAMLVIFCLPALLAQPSDKDPMFGIQFKGFVKTDMIYDSRQTVASREGHFLLWPQPELLDVNDQDMNGKDNFNMLSVQSRLTGVISGPDAFGAKTSGLMEGAFFGHSNPDINGFRLRHAFLKLNWEKSTLLVGQTWNPLFIVHSFPGVVSFNTGSPFQPFSRNPQLRFTYQLGSQFNVVAAAVSQRDFASRGPVGVSSSYLRNSVLPDMHVQLHYASAQDGSNSFSSGVGVAYKEIVPRLTSYDGDSALVRVDERLGSFIAMGYAAYKTKPLTINAQAVYGQNMSDLLMLGGYGVVNQDPVSGVADYAAVNAFSAWLDVHTNGKAVQVGLFAGYTENLGADQDINGAIYGLGNDIRYLYRVAPRVMVNSGKTRFAFETEYTTAAYGTAFNNKAMPLNPKEVANLRLLLAAYYFF